MKLEKYSIGIGDRFAHQGEAQLDSVIKANYDRYINNPSESKKIYKNIANSICAESIFPVDE